MTPAATDPRAELQAAMAALDSHRPRLGEKVVESLLAAARAKLSLLEEAQPQRRQVTVLCADLSGFTAMAERMEADDVGQTLRELWRRLDAVVHRHGGWVAQHVGDALQAVFGWHRAAEDDPSRAVDAALAIQDELARHPQPHGGERLWMRIGIHTAEAILGAVGGSGEQGATGPAAIIAERLQRACPPGGVLLSRDNWRLVRRAFLAEPLPGPDHAGPSEGYLVRGPRAAEPQAASETPCVGRDAELAALARAFAETCAGGEPRWVTIAGDAGVGKSRLLHELAALLGADARGPRVLSCQARAGAPQLLGALLAPARLAPRAEATGDQALRRAVREVARAAAERPLAFLLDDLQEADPSVLDLLQALGSSSAPIFVVAATRRGGRDESDLAEPAATRRRTITLEPLAPAASRALCGAILGSDPPEDLARIVVAHAEGNPLYIIELVRMLIEDGGLMPSGAGFRLNATALRDLRIPTTIVGLLQARLDALSPAELRTLQLASVVGRTFWAEAVAHMSVAAGEGALASQVAASLASLERQGIVRRHPDSTVPDAAELSFTHASVRELAYERILRGERRAHHRSGADWLLKRELGNAGARAIAEQLRGAGSSEAVAFYLRAGNWAQSHGAIEDALACCETALSLVAPDRHAEQSTIHIALAGALRLRGRLGDSLAANRQALALARAAGDQALAVKSAVGIAGIQDVQGDFRDALDTIQEAEHAVRDVAKRTLSVEVCYQKGWILYHLGSYAAAREAGQECLRLLAEQREAAPDSGEIQPGCDNLLGSAAEALGRFREAREHKERSLALYRQIGSSTGEASLQSNLGENARLRGEPEQALAYFEQAIQTTTAQGDIYLELLARCGKAGALLDLGRHREAVADCRRLLDEAPPKWFALPTAWLFLAEALLELGAHDEALSYARKALHQATRTGDPENTAHAWRVLGRLSSGQGTPIEGTAGTCLGASTCFCLAIEALPEDLLPRDRACVLADWARHELHHGDATRGRELWARARALFVRLELDAMVARMDAESSVTTE